jgi:galactokinase
MPAATSAFAVPAHFLSSGVLVSATEGSVEEIERTRQVIPLLEQKKTREFGLLMNACHVSLRDLYEVSVPELDSMVANAQPLPGCFGARLTGLHPEIYICQASQGAGLI